MTWTDSWETADLSLAQAVDSAYLWFRLKSVYYKGLYVNTETHTANVSKSLRPYPKVKNVYVINDIISQWINLTDNFCIHFRISFTSPQASTE